MLAHKPDGDCYYLGETGCTIHARKPIQCQEMDCRLIASEISYTKARQLDRKKALPLAIWRQGRNLLKGKR
jgi:hypothetical protein